MKKCPILLSLIALFGLLSCEEELSSIQLDRNEIIIHYDESEQLNVTYSPTDVDVPPVLIWETANNKIAKVSSNGTVAGVRVGETSVVVKTMDEKFVDSCTVIVESQSQLYTEPIYDLGQSISYVKSNEARNLLLEESDRLIFEDSNANVIYVMYLFGVDGLERVTLLLKNGVWESAKLFLTERYEPYNSISDKLYFKINEQVMVELGTDPTLGLLLTYKANTRESSTRP